MIWELKGWLWCPLSFSDMCTTLVIIWMEKSNWTRSKSFDVPHFKLCPPPTTIHPLEYNGYNSFYLLIECRVWVSHKCKGVGDGHFWLVFTISLWACLYQCDFWIQWDNAVGISTQGLYCSRCFTHIHPKTPTPVCIFSIHFQGYWQREFVERSRAYLVGDPFLNFMTLMCDSGVIVRGEIRRISLPGVKV